MIMKIPLPLTVSFFLLFSSAVFSQTTWYVDQSGAGDFVGIQQAIDDASVINGDTVIVRNGIYSENINFAAKAITLVSAYGPTNTIINGNFVGRVVSFDQGEGPGSVLDGFTITNGLFYGDGAGVACISASPTIRNNVISGNITNNSGNGAGIFCSNSSSLIENNDISGNTSRGDGGGIFCTNCPAMVIQGNTIGGNSGSGIYGSSSTVDIINNNIQGNSSIGISCSSSDMNVDSNNISGNTYGINGHSTSSLIVSGNIISNNSYAGIRCSSSTSITAISNTISFNGEEGIDISGGSIIAESNVISDNNDSGPHHQRARHTHCESHTH